MKSLLEELLEKTTLTRVKDPATGQEKVVAQVPDEELKRLAQRVADPLAAAPEPLRLALRSLSTVRFFDQAFAERCLLTNQPGAASFGEVVESPYVEALPGPGRRWRLLRPYQEAAFKSWWAEQPPDFTAPPQPLRELSACVAGDYANRGDHAEQLYHLVLADPGEAKDLFRRLFDQADQNFNLARCLALVNVLQERERFLDADFYRLYQDKKLRLDVRSLWSREYYSTLTYFEREKTRRLLPDLLDPANTRYWILHLYAIGGMGKSSFIRHGIAQYCVPRGIPCALVDFDDKQNILEVSQTPGLLLLRIAEQFNSQLPQLPFGELLADNAPLFNAPTTTAPASAAPATAVPAANAEEQAGLVERLLQRFVDVMADARGDAPFLLIFDTMEELRTRPLDLSRALDMLARLKQGCPGLRVILAGRFYLGEEGGPQTAEMRFPARLPGFVERFGDQEEPFLLDYFDEAESRAYLEEKRGMLGDPRVKAIIARGGGHPFKLAVLADYVHANPQTTHEEIEELVDVSLVYVIDRIINRIHDPLLQLVVRYGVVPRHLTLQFLEAVMIPYIEKLAAGDTSLDDPTRDELPHQLLGSQGKPFLPENFRSPIDAQALWAQLSQYVSQVSWITQSERVPKAVSFQTDVVQPMRFLLLRQKDSNRLIYVTLNREASLYYERAANSTNEADHRTRAVREAVFHRFQEGDPDEGARYWKEQMAAAAGDSATRLALAEEAYDLAEPEEPALPGEPVGDQLVTAEVRGLAAFELAYQRLADDLLEGSRPVQAVEWSEIKKELHLAETTPGVAEQIHPARMACARGRVLLANLDPAAAYQAALAGLQAGAAGKGGGEGEPAASGAVEESKVGAGISADTPSSTIVALHLLAAAALRQHADRALAAGAANHYRAALQLTGPLEPVRTAHIRGLLAGALEEQQDYAGAAEVYRQLTSAALAEGDYPRAARRLIDQVRMHNQMGTEAGGVRLGDSGLEKIRGATPGMSPAAREASLPWAAVLAAELELARGFPARALREVDSARLSGGPTQAAEPPEGLPAAVEEVRARCFAALWDIAQAVAAYENLGADFFPTPNPRSFHAFRAAAELFIHQLGSPVVGFALLRNLYPNPGELSAWLRLVEIQYWAAIGRERKARSAAKKLAAESNPNWPPDLRARVALEWLVQAAQGGRSKAALEGLAPHLQAVTPDTRRLLILAEGLRRLEKPLSKRSAPAKRLLALLPERSAWGQDPLYAALRLGEVHRALGQAKEARELLHHALTQASTPLRLAPLGEILRAFDRLGWQPGELERIPLPPAGHPEWSENNELSGVLLLEQAERRLFTLGDLTGAGELLGRASSLLNEPSSLWQRRLVTLRAIIHVIQTQPGAGEGAEAAPLVGANNLVGAGSPRPVNGEPTANALGDDDPHAVTRRGDPSSSLPPTRNDDPNSSVGAGGYTQTREGLAALDELLRAVTLVKDAGFLRPAERVLGRLLAAAERCYPPGTPHAAALADRVGLVFNGNGWNSAAVEAFTWAVDHTAPDSPSLPGYLFNLGTALHTSYTQDRKPVDLELAGRALTLAIQLAPPDSAVADYYRQHLMAVQRDRALRAAQETGSFSAGEAMLEESPPAAEPTDVPKSPVTPPAASEPSAKPTMPDDEPAKRVWLVDFAAPILTPEPEQPMHVLHLEILPGGEWEVTILFARSRSKNSMRVVQSPPTLPNPAITGIVYPGEQEAINEEMVQYLAKDWQGVARRLGELLLPHPLLEELSQEQDPFHLALHVPDPRLAWLPWEMILTGQPRGELAEVMRNCAGVTRFAPNLRPAQPVGGARVDVLIVRAGEEIEQRAQRGYAPSPGESMGARYLRAGLRVEEITAADLYALEEQVAGLRPRVVHLLAGIRDRGRRLLLDFGGPSPLIKSSGQRVSLSVRDLTNLLHGAGGGGAYTPVLVLDPPTPPGQHERMRQLCLRNAFAAELAASPSAVSVILAAGLRANPRDSSLSAVLARALAQSRPPIRLAEELAGIGRSSEGEGPNQMEYLGVGVFASRPGEGMAVRGEASSS